MIPRPSSALSILRRRSSASCGLRSVSVLVIAAAVAIASAGVRAGVTEVDNAALAALLEEGATIVDVRRADEWRERGVLAGSHPLTFFDARGRYDVDAWLAALEEIVGPDDEIVLVCAHGVRSKRVADLLDARLGFTAVRNVTDGIEGWRESGGAITPYGTGVTSRDTGRTGIEAEE